MEYGIYSEPAYVRMPGIKQKEVTMVWGSYGWGMGYSWIYMIVFWVVVITAIAYLTKFIIKRSDSKSGMNRRLISLNDATQNERLPEKNMKECAMMLKNHEEGTA